MIFFCFTFNCLGCMPTVLNKGLEPLLKKRTVNIILASLAVVEGVACPRPSSNFDGAGLFIHGIRTPNRKGQSMNKLIAWPLTEVYTHRMAFAQGNTRDKLRAGRVLGNKVFDYYETYDDYLNERKSFERDPDSEQSKKRAMELSDLLEWDILNFQDTQLPNSERQLTK